jgi:transcriptional regulator with XRE-family HTH domain
MNERFQLIDKLEKSRASREAYTRSKISVNIPSQIRALRRRRKLTQQELAQEADMKQSRISAMERPGTKLNIETLIRIAAAFRTGLVVTFAPFSDMLDWENSFSQDSFDAAKIEDDWKFKGRRVAARYRQRSAKRNVSLIPGTTGTSTNPGNTQQAQQLSLFGGQVKTWPNLASTTPNAQRSWGLSAMKTAAGTNIGVRYGT